jgi:serine/threonine protein kinase
MKDVLIGNRYHVIGPLGSGGEAHVFRARDATTEGEVAVRLAHQPGAFIPVRHLPAFHPGWVQFLDWGLDPAYGAYEVFELLAGRTLDQTIQSAPLDAERWLSFVHESLDAVGALHEAGWIHGDLNAGNFIQADSGWKLLELPFLRFEIPAGRTPLFGSIYTLTPEQLDGTPVDVRSDLYALGCLYYYAASGRYPHAGHSSQEIAINRLRFPATPLNDLVPHLPEAWDNWVMTLLQREPQNRFPTVLAARQLLKIA